MPPRQFHLWSAVVSWDWLAKNRHCGNKVCLSLGFPGRRFVHSWKFTKWQQRAFNWGSICPAEMPLGYVAYRRSCHGGPPLLTLPHDITGRRGMARSRSGSLLLSPQRTWLHAEHHLLLHADFTRRFHTGPVPTLLAPRILIYLIFENPVFLLGAKNDMIFTFIDSIW